MITPCGAAHPPVMAAIHASAFAGAEAWDASIMAAQLGQPGVFGFVHESGGMILARVAADEAEILTLAVVPEARRQGCAASLLSAAMQAARGRGAARLFLEVSTHNIPARALYTGAGFAEAGQRRRYYADGSDALILVANLLPSATQSNGRTT